MKGLKLPNEIDEMIDDYVLFNKIVDAFKMTIFEILTQDLDWRRYEVCRNDYISKYSSLDEYIDAISSNFYNEIKSKKVCCDRFACSFENGIELSKYLPCMNTLHGDDGDRITESFIACARIEDIKCAECLKENNVNEQ